MLFFTSSGLGGRGIGDALFPQAIDPISSAKLCYSLLTLFTPLLMVLH
jgi:hypothetical protein